MEDINNLRKQIDDVDHQIIKLLAIRIQIVKKIGEIKKTMQKEIVDEERWNAVISERGKTGVRLGLPLKFIQDVWNTIHDYAQKTEKEL